MRRDSLSVSEKLLLAAYDLEQNGRHAFSAEDLVIVAWQRYPDTFGLAGHRDQNGKLAYPDSNRVFAEIMGSKPIRKRGLLIKVGNKMYQLTEAGCEQARFLQNQGKVVSAKKAALGRETEKELKRLFGSKALLKVKGERIEDLTFYNACSFWGITPMSSGIKLKGQIANFEGMIDAAQRVVQHTAATFGHSGQVFGASDLKDLIRTHEVLMEKFQAELTFIGERKDERSI